MVLCRFIICAPAAVPALALWSAVALAQAQGVSGGASRSNPLDASAPVPQAVYRSALGEHRAYRAEDVGSWVKANETVNRVGGWRVYAREGEAASAPGPTTGSTEMPTPGAAPRSAPAPAPVPAPTPAGASSAVPPASMTPAPAHRHR